MKMDIVERIKSLADKQGMTLKELALKLGFGENSIYRWNKNKPSLGNVEKVADYFDVSTDFLLGRDSTGKSISNETDSIMMFRIDTDGMTDEDKQILKEDLDDFLEVRRKRLEARNKRNKGDN